MTPAIDENDVPAGWDPPPSADEATAQEIAAWTPIDTPYSASGPPLFPNILRTEVGALFYRGMRHLVSAEPEGLKTWLAAAGAAELLMNDEPVFWWDADGMGRTILVERLEVLGASPDNINDGLLYVAPEVPLRQAGRELLRRVVSERPIALAVVDALNPALELQCLDPNSTADVQTFLREVIGIFHDARVATLLIDHVAKSKDARGSWAYGSERKVGGVDVHLGLELVGEPPTRDRPQGRVVIRAQKDRPGAHRRGPNKRIGEFILDTSASPAWRLELTPEFTGPTGATPDGFRPTFLMERISRHLEISISPVSRSAILEEVRGKASGLRQAIDVLAREGYASAEPGRQSGAFTYRSERPFRQADDEGPGAQPGPNPVPGLSGSPGPTRSGVGPSEEADAQGVLGNPVPPGPTPSPTPPDSPVPGPSPPYRGGPGQGGTASNGSGALPGAIADEDLERFERVAATAPATDPVATRGAA